MNDEPSTALERALATVVAFEDAGIEVPKILERPCVQCGDREADLGYENCFTCYVLTAA